METILEVSQVAKHFGGFTALHSIDLQLKKGERLGLIGPNGSGKTTLINCISGALQNDGGSIKFEGRELTGLQAFQRTRLGIARSFQIPRPFRSMTVLENLMVPLAYVGGISGHKAQEEAMRILSSMRLDAKAQTLSGSLSQVELRKMELARAVAAKPKLLVSDEAMAGLAGAEIDEVLELLFELNKMGITIIMIEHIMRAVMEFSQRLAVLVAGKKIADGDPKEVVRHPEVVRAYLGE